MIQQSEAKKNWLPLAAFKDGYLHVSPTGDTISFSRGNVSQEYPVAYRDFIIEWGQLDMRIDKKTKDLISKFSDLYENDFPASCHFKDGRSSEFCVIHFSDMPPPKTFFERATFSPSWYYFNQVAEITESNRAIPLPVAKEMKKRKTIAERMSRDIRKLKSSVDDNAEHIRSFPNTKTVVRDEKGNYYKFSEPEFFVYERFVQAQTLQLIRNPSEQQITASIELSVDRDLFRNYSPPIVKIFASPIH